MTDKDDMEKMLFDGLDSSSDDSDKDEILEEVTTGSAMPGASAVAPAVQPTTKPVAPAASMPASVPVSAAPANMSQAERSSMLKSLYSAKSQPGGQPAPSASRPQQSPPAQRRPAMVQTTAPMTTAQPQQAPPHAGMHPLVPNRRPSQGAPAPPAPPPADPFEPTPLSKMIQRQQVKAAATNQPRVPQMPSPAAAASRKTSGSSASGVSMNRALNASPTASSLRSTGGNSSLGATSTVAQSLTTEQRAKVQREAKDRKDKFLMFTRVLMKYLESKDQAMHSKARLLIRDCAERNKRKEPGFESLTASMERRLKDLVGPTYWNKAHQYLQHLLREKTKLGGKGGRSSQSSAQSSSNSSAQAKKAAEAKAVAVLQQRRKDDEMRKQLATAKGSQGQRQQTTVQQQVVLERMKRENEAKMAALRKNAATLPATMLAAAAKKKGGKMATSVAAVGAPQTTDSQREYSDLMEMVDHAVTYDWSTAGLLLGREAKGEVSLGDEQRNLLYGSTTRPKVHPTTGSSNQLPATMRGWGKRNVLTPRIAWARVRLREQKRELLEAQANESKRSVPVIGGLTLPSKPKEDLPLSKTSSLTTWLNEDRAEEDKTLAALSEAMQIYLKSALEKAVIAARQRQNLDGIRLWHEQHGVHRPPMALRLGCDVKRQIAQASSNAALSCQRMEEALGRQDDVPEKLRDLQDSNVLYQATSMGDLSVRPRLSKATTEASTDAKRSLDVFGGKDAGLEPPLGRVPKRPKILVRDFSMGLDWTNYAHQRRGIAGSSLI